MRGAIPNWNTMVNRERGKRRKQLRICEAEMLESYKSTIDGIKARRPWGKKEGGCDDRAETCGR